MVKVINAVSWSGEDFNYAPGEVIELDAKTAKARVDAGLATWPERPGQEEEPAAPEGEAPAGETTTDPEVQPVGEEVPTDEAAAPAGETPPAEEPAAPEGEETQTVERGGRTERTAATTGGPEKRGAGKSRE